MKLNKYSFAGIAAAIIYMLTIIVGGVLRTGYTPFIDPVSRIFARGLPLSWLVVLFLVVSNILIIYLAFGIIKASKSKLIRAGAVVLILASIVACVLFVFFPMDPWNGIRTANDVIHNDIVKIIAALILVSMALLYLGSHQDKIFTKLSNYFLASTIIYFLMSTASGYCLYFLPSLTGTFESLWILTFLQWIVAIALLI